MPAQSGGTARKKLSQTCQSSDRIPSPYLRGQSPAPPRCTHLKWTVSPGPGPIPINVISGFFWFWEMKYSHIPGRCKRSRFLCIHTLSCRLQIPAARWQCRPLRHFCAISASLLTSRIFGVAVRQCILLCESVQKWMSLLRWTRCVLRGLRQCTLRGRRQRHAYIRGGRYIVRSVHES